MRMGGCQRQLERAACCGTQLLQKPGNVLLLAQRADRRGFRAKVGVWLVPPAGLRVARLCGWLVPSLALWMHARFAMEIVS